MSVIVVNMSFKFFELPLPSLVQIIGGILHISNFPNNNVEAINVHDTKYKGSF